MNNGDIIEAQVLNNFQLQLIRNKIVLERMRLVSAVLSLYPNFNVTDSANMTQLYNDLQALYPETKNAIQVATLTNTINDRILRLEKLRLDLGLKKDQLNIEIDWKGVPLNATVYKNKASQVLEFMIETERLKTERSIKEKSIL